MANTNAVWGIDIGQCSLKALRCTPGEDGKLVAEAFDYIEYPKILSQPDANPEELIKEALEQFLSRNEVKGDRVAISVSGQAGLSRFFKPPPVDAKTLPDIVKFEARQQIPFALEDVIWDYQQIGGKIVDGVTVDAEVGLFAMKREAVFKALQPFLDADIEVDIVQLSPLTIYNVVLNDLLTNLPDPEEIDPKKPPESLVVIAMGTDTTDLVITDGYKLWLRNIPIGGNHFTRQLSRELKLTYAKAEHLKRNARKAEDPKTIFQAMRAVFSDLVTELQRSISYFQGIERNAKIGHVAMFGNASNLPGLRQYLTKHLGIEISKVSEFKSLTGSSVIGSKQFQENFLSYSVCYGLCLQALDEARLKTNLLPQEFLTERLIRAKKPWALGAVSALLMGLMVYYFMIFGAWKSVHPDTTVGQVSWKAAMDEVDSVKNLVNGFAAADQDQMLKLKEVHEMENSVSGVTDGRRLWPELLSTLHQLLPPYPPEGARPGDPQFKDVMAMKSVDPLVTPYVNRPDIYVEYVETKYYPDLATWYTGAIKEKYDEQKLYVEALIEADKPPEEKDAAAQDATAQAGQPGGVQPGAGQPGTMQPGTMQPGTMQPGMNATGAPVPEGPKGPGWVLEIKGHHFMNGPQHRAAGTGGPSYVKRTIMRHILDPSTRIWLPMPPGYQQDMMRFTVKEMGLQYPVITDDPPINFGFTIPNVNYSGGTAANGPGREDGEEGPQAVDEPMEFEAPKYDFVMQIVWIPTTVSERLEKREERRKQQEAQAGGQPGPGQPGAGQGNTTPNRTTPNQTTPNQTTPRNPAGGGANSNPGAGQPGAAQPAADNQGSQDAGAAEEAPGAAQGAQGNGETPPDAGTDPAADAATDPDGAPAGNGGSGPANSGL